MNMTLLNLVQGLRLTTTKLMSACASSIKYTGKQDKPACLIDKDDAFCSRLSDNYTTDPKPTTETHRVQFFTMGPRTSDSEDTESSSDEFQVSVAWDATGENETLPEQGTV